MHGCLSHLSLCWHCDGCCHALGVTYPLACDSCDRLQPILNKMKWVYKNEWMNLNQVVEISSRSYPLI